LSITRWSGTVTSVWPESSIQLGTNVTATPSTARAPAISRFIPHLRLVRGTGIFGVDAVNTAFETRVFERVQVRKLLVDIGLLVRRLLRQHLRDQNVLDAAHAEPRGQHELAAPRTRTADAVDDDVVTALRSAPQDLIAARALALAALRAGAHVASSLVRGRRNLAVRS
jgi:hypothetical protein